MSAGFPPLIDSPPGATTFTEYDAIIIGSGFGGAMAAVPLVNAGWRVLMVERGSWVERGPHNWEREGAFIHTPHYAPDTAFRVVPASRVSTQRLCTCVGGASVFFGGAAFRFREEDFVPHEEIVAGSGAEWPFRYADLEPFYAEAESLLHVAGEAGDDPTAPPRSGPYPASPFALSGAARRIADAARSLGMRPFRIPLAINHEADHGATCARCTTCDAYACAVGAKGDLATRVIPSLLREGMHLLPETVAVRLNAERGRVTSVTCVDKGTGALLTLRARSYVLAAGALATPHLLLASDLARVNPAGDAVGRYLMRHCNAMTYGIFASPPNPANEHHKQIAIHDFYLGADARGAPAGKLGNLQQIMAPAPGLLQHVLPELLARKLGPLTRYLTGMLVVAEDQPRRHNHVYLGAGGVDRFGLPELIVEHRYSPRDLAARRFLVRQAKRILRRAGASATFAWKVSTFSHAIGTVRLGDDPLTAPLDPSCRYRGLDNLLVTDGSAFPTAAGVNPSLTIAAIALRAGCLMAERGIA